jgi:4-hydroxybenzoate polyprenyltransferase
MNSNKRSRLEKIYQQSVLKPPYTAQPFVRRFWTYQNERYPIAVFAIISGLLVLALAKVDGNFDWTRIAIAASMAILYFMQIRVADEPKDFEHDNIHHPERPVQRGVITLVELSRIKLFCVIGFLLLACLTGSPLVIGLAVLQQCYAYLTRKEFFMREWLRKHFFIYQYSHYAQLLLLAWLLVVAGGVVGPWTEQLLYIGYVIAMIAPIEASRTIGGSDEAKAHDRYSHIIGVVPALVGYLLFTFVAVGYTIFLVGYGDDTFNPLLVIAGLAVVTWASLRYEHKPIAKHAAILNGVSLLMYIACAGTVLIG